MIPAARPHGGHGRVTLADIAAAAGVSVPTVSKVVHGRGSIAPDTRSRVEAALTRTRYAAPRRRDRSGLISLVLTHLSPWSAEIIRGAEEAAFAGDCRIVVSVVADAQASDEWLIRACTSRADGVILALNDLPTAHHAHLAELHVPVVIIDSVGRPVPHVPSIGAANRTGGFIAGSHLTELGHRRIGTITGRPTLPCSRARLDGYRAALDRAGIRVDPALIRCGYFRFEAALRAATEMLTLDNPPTAIFAGSDLQAMGVYEAARRHHLRIPDDLSVVGFDDLEMSSWAPPPLTTVAQPLAQMATRATRMLLNFRDGTADMCGSHVELSTPLVGRASTSPPAAAYRKRRTALVPEPVPRTRSGRNVTCPVPSCRSRVTALSTPRAAR